jgi:hypothetical protein
LGWEVVEWDPKVSSEVETRNQYGGEFTKARFSLLICVPRLWTLADFMPLPEREGMSRIKEVLETHDWSMAGGNSGFDGDDDPDMDSEEDLQDQLLGLGSSRGFGDEVHELEREMFGLRMAIERGGGDGDERDDSDHDDGEDEIDVESMEALMMRMQAIKGMILLIPWLAIVDIGANLTIRYEL